MVNIVDALKLLIRQGYDLLCDISSSHDKYASSGWSTKPQAEFDADLLSRKKVYFDTCRSTLSTIDDVLMIEFSLVGTTRIRDGQKGASLLYRNQIPLIEARIRFLIQKLEKFSSFGKIELFVDDITTFEKVKSVSPSEVKEYLPLNMLEEEVQTALEDIIGENFHQIDWAGEDNDICTSFVRINDERVPSSIMLKGRGTPRPLRIAGCGKNGDQILRLTRPKAVLYIIQHVNKIEQDVRDDITQKIMLKRAQGEIAYCCIIDGTDTARILKAYGKLPK